MSAAGPIHGQRSYKVQHSSGRVLGPLDLERVRQLILKNQLLGEELARVYPDGEWTPLAQIPEIGELLLDHAQGVLREKNLQVPPEFASTRVMLPELEDHAHQVDPTNTSVSSSSEKTRLLGPSRGLSLIHI